MSILAIALMNLISNLKSSTKVSSEELEEALILAYRLADFEKTMLKNGQLFFFLSIAIFTTKILFLHFRRSVNYNSVN